MGSLDSVAEVMRESTLNPPSFYHGTINVSASLASSDGRSVKAFATITLYPVNHAPSIEIMTDVIPDIGKLQLSAVMSVTDIDITFLETTNDTLYYSFPAYCCFLKLNITCVNCILQSAQYTDSVMMVGTPSDLIAMLSVVNVLPQDTTSSSYMSLLVSLDDLQSYGAGEPITVFRNISLSYASSTPFPIVDIPNEIIVRTFGEFLLAELAQKQVSISNLPSNGIFRLEMDSQGGGQIIIGSSPDKAQSGTSPSSFISINGTISDINYMLNRIYYTAPHKSTDTLNLYIFKDQNVLINTKINVVVQAMFVPLSLNFSTSSVMISEGAILGFDELLAHNTVPSPEVLGDGSVVYSANIAIYRENTIEVQRVTIDAVYQPMVQLIYVDAPLNDTISHGNLSLSLSLHTFGLGEIKSSALFVDPYPIHWIDIMNHSPSLFSPSLDNLEVTMINFLSSLETIGITVTISRSSSARKVEWAVTFNNAPINFPVLQIVDCQIISLAGCTFETVDNQLKFY